MNRDNKRLEKIKADRIELLKKVRDSISTNGNNLNSDISVMNEMIKYDTMSIQKLESVEKAQALISSLIEQVIDAQTNEEVEALRKKINYLINKIKKEIKKRRIDADELVSYQEKVSYLRKDMAKYVRYLKRESNIQEIEDKLNNYGELTSEDKKRLKKLLRNERQYTTRNILGKTYKKKTVKKEEPVKQEIKLAEKIKETIISDDYEEMNRFLNERTKDFNAQYEIENIYEYGDSKIENIKKFFKNIPIYIRNKRGLRNMHNDIYSFYNGGDLIGYAEYVRRRNSIKNGLRALFSKTYLYSKEGIYLNTHEKCSEWLYDFCEENGLALPLIVKGKRVIC